MFPKNRINIIYRLLCLISFIIVIWLINSQTTLIVIFIVYIFFALSERSFRNIELIIITGICLWISYLLDNYLLFKLLLSIDYIIYFLDTSYYFDEDEKINVSKEEFIRFKNVSKKKKKGSNNITALYLTVHLVILFISIMVG